MTAPTATPAITVTNDGRVITRTCPAGHTYVSGLHADGVLLGTWEKAHETHEGER